MKRPLAAGVAVLSALTLMLAGCGSDSLSGGGAASPSSSMPAVEASQALHDSLPDKIKQAGVIEMGVDPTYKPNEWMEGTTIKGMNVEIFDAVAARMGVKANWNPSQFDAILAGVQGLKYDVGSSSFTITAKRMENVTFVQYLNVGTQWATLAGNPKSVDPKDPCGKTIAYQTGTTQEEEIRAAQATCAQPIIELPYTGQDEVNNALAIGKADAMLADYPITQNAILTSGGKMEALGEQYGAAPYGFALAKDNLQLAEAISKALEDLKASGHYEAILADYGVTQAAVSSFPVNPQVS